MKVKVTQSDSLQPHGLYNPWNSPGWNTGMGSLSFLQGIFPTQGLNEPRSPMLQVDFVPAELTREAIFQYLNIILNYIVIHAYL